MPVSKAASAGIWSGLDIVLRQGIQFVTSVILARLLMPEDFGVIALMTLFSNLSIVFLQGGLTAALVQRQETSLEQESAIFWCNLGASIVFAIVLLAIAPAVSTFYGHPILRELMAIAAIQVVLSALGSVQTALFTRDLNFLPLTQIGVASTLVSGAVGVGAAFSGAGIWALAIQFGLLALVNSAGLWLLSSWRPLLRVRVRSLRGMLSFGFYFSLSSTLDVFATQGFALLVGKLHGAHELGLFTRAAGTQALPGNIITTMVGRVAFPLFAARKSDTEALRRALKLSVDWTMLLNLPAMVGLSLVSDLVLTTLFGEKWVSAAPVLSLLALAGTVAPLNVLNLQLLLGQGRSKTYLLLEICKKIVLISAVIVGSLYGIVGLAYAIIVISAASFVINAEPTRRSMQYGALAQLWHLRGILTATAFMAGVILLVRHFVTLPPQSMLLIVLLSGAVSYAAFGFIFKIRGFEEGLNLLRDLIRRRRLATS